MGFFCIVLNRNCQVSESILLLSLGQQYLTYRGHSGDHSQATALPSSSHPSSLDYRARHVPQSVFKVSEASSYLICIVQSLRNVKKKKTIFNVMYIKNYNGFIDFQRLVTTKSILKVCFSLLYVSKNKVLKSK